jgi:hypothetical protein
MRHPSIILTVARGLCQNKRSVAGRAVNSSRTWKTGERCQISGTYRCQVCGSAGRETMREFVAGRVIPMCDACPEKDATWRLVKAAPAATA